MKVVICKNRKIAKAGEKMAGRHMYVKACDLGKHACALCFKSAVGGLSLGLGVFSRPLLLQTASFLQDTCPRGIAATSPTPEGVPLSSAGTVLLTGQPESP